jgi:hypothetical protein
VKVADHASARRLQHCDALGGGDVMIEADDDADSLGSAR